MIFFSFTPFNYAVVSVCRLSRSWYFSHNVVTSLIFSIFYLWSWYFSYYPTFSFKPQSLIITLIFWTLILLCLLFPWPSNITRNRFMFPSYLIFSSYFISSMPAVEYTKAFTISVVMGKDVVPRIGLHQMEALRADLITAIKRSVDPKVSRIFFDITST